MLKTFKNGRKHDMLLTKKSLQLFGLLRIFRLFAMICTAYVAFAISVPAYGTAATLSGVVIDDTRDVALPGISIQLSLDENFDVRFYSTSDSTGQFYFTGIPAGRYSMEFYGRYPWRPVFVTAGDKGYGIQPSTIFDIEVTAGDALSGYVFDTVIESYVDYLTGFVFSDENNNGKRENNEFGIHSVVVKAENDIGDALQTQTDDDGYYEFILDAGFDWTISEVQPTGWQDGSELTLPNNPSISVSDDRYNLFTFGGSLTGSLNFAERGRYTLEHDVWQLISLPVDPTATQYRLRLANLDVLLPRLNLRI